MKKIKQIVQLRCKTIREINQWLLCQKDNAVDSVTITNYDVGNDAHFNAVVVVNESI